MSARCALPLALGSLLGALALTCPATALTGDAPLAAETPDIRFADDFFGAQLDPRKWRGARGAAPSFETIIPAVRLADTPAGFAVLRSARIALEDVGSAVLSYTLWSASTDANDHLLTDFQDAGGRWRRLDRISAWEAGTSDQARRVSITLPHDAFHADFALRFRTQSHSGETAWFLAEMTLTAYAADTILTALTAPDSRAALTVIDAESRSRVDQAAPLSYACAAGARIDLVAPARINGWVFSHWTLDGERRFDRSRQMQVEMADDVEAVAHYWPTGPRAFTGVLRIDSSPVPQIPLTVALASRGPHAAGRTPFDYTGLIGEELEVAAAAQTETLAFVRWWLDGEPQRIGDAQLRVTLRDDAEAVAEYALIGDLNRDGVLDELDVEAFILALGDSGAYSRRYPGVPRILLGDVNRDGDLDELDVAPFVELFFDAE